MVALSPYSKQFVSSSSMNPPNSSWQDHPLSFNLSTLFNINSITRSEYLNSDADHISTSYIYCLHTFIESFAYTQINMQDGHR